MLLFFGMQTLILFLLRRIENTLERVLARSLWLNEDLVKLENFYDKDLIISLVVNSGQIFGNEQIEEIAEHYQINPKNFVRYI